MSAEPRGPSAHRTRVVLLVGFGLLVLGLLAVAAVTYTRSEAEVEPALTASPIPGVTATVFPPRLEDRGPTPSPSVTPTRPTSRPADASPS